MQLIGGFALITIVMGAVFGLGAIALVGAGRLDVVGFFISLFWITAIANPCVAEIFYVGGIEQQRQYLERFMMIAYLLATNQFFNTPGVVAYGCDFDLVGLPKLEGILMTGGIPELITAVLPILFLGLFSVPRAAISLANVLVNINNPANLPDAVAGAITAIIDIRLSNLVVYFGSQSIGLPTVSINIPLGGPPELQRRRELGLIESEESRTLETLEPVKPEESKPLPTCAMCNSTRMVVKGLNSEQCVISDTCPKKNKAQPDFLSPQDFTTCTVFSADFIFTCTLAQNETSCSDGKKLQSALEAILGFPQTGAYLTITNSSFAYKNDLAKDPPTTPVPAGEASSCLNQTTYQIYATGAEEVHIDSIRGLLGNLSRNEPSSVNPLFMQINNTQAPLCGVSIKNIKGYLAPFVKIHMPRRVHAFEGRTLKEVMAPRVMVTQHNCTDHSILTEVGAGEKISVWLEGFPPGSDLVVQLMGYDEEVGMQEGEVLATLQNFDASSGPISWTGRVSPKQPPGMYSLKVYRALKSTEGYMYSQAFMVLESSKKGDSEEENLFHRTRRSRRGSHGGGKFGI